MAIRSKTLIEARANPYQMTEAERARILAMTEEEIEAAALADPDNPPWTDEELAEARRERDERLAEKPVRDHHLYFIAEISRDEPVNTMQVNALEQLSAESVDRCRIAIKQVTEYFASQSVIVGLMGNAFDVVNSMNEIIKAYSDQPALAEIIIEQGSQQISRHFANMCSLFRSFLDHFDKYFVDNHGKNSENYSKWREVLAQEYDNKLSYKIVYMMRNYIQHRDMPPLSITISDSIKSRKFEAKVSIQINTMHQDREFFKKLKGDEKDIETMLLTQIMSDFGDALGSILDFANKIRMKDAEPASNEILSFRIKHEVSGTSRIAMIRLPKTDVKPEKLNLHFEWLPEQRANQIIENLRTANKVREGNLS